MVLNAQPKLTNGGGDLWSIVQKMRSNAPQPARTANNAWQPQGEADAGWGTQPYLPPGYGTMQGQFTQRGGTMPMQYAQAGPPPTTPGGLSAPYATGQTQGQYTPPGYGTQAGQFTQSTPGKWPDGTPITTTGTPGATGTIGNWGGYTPNTAPMEYMPSDRLQPTTPPATSQGGGAAAATGGRWSGVKTGNGANFTFTGPNGQRVEWKTGFGSHADVVKALTTLGLGDYASKFAEHLVTQANRTISGHNTQRPIDAFFYDLASQMSGGKDPASAAQAALQGLRTRYGTLKGTGFDALDGTTPGAPKVGPNDPQNPLLPPGTPQGAVGTSPGSAPGTPPGAPPGTPPSTPPGKGSVYGNAVGILTSDPDAAYRAIMQRMGFDPNIKGAFDKYMRQRVGQAVSTIIGAKRTNGQLPDSADAILDEIGRAAFTPGGNYYSYITGIADKALGNLQGTYGGDASFEYLDPFIYDLIGLKADAMNNVAGNAMFNEYGSTRGGYRDEAINNGGVNKTRFSDYLAGSNFGKRFAPR